MPREADLALTDAQLTRFWSRVGLPDENGCMLWLGAPRYNNGYGRIQINGTSYVATRLSLLLAEGPPPQDSMHAAHGCRNRICVAPAHLRWATPIENNADKHRDGTAQNGERASLAKLTEDQVRTIRARLAAGQTKASLAREYRVTETTIYGIDRGLTWRHLLEDAS